MSAAEQRENCDVIEALIQQKQPFAMYRIPGEETPRFLMRTDGAVRLIYHIEELNEEKGFVIAPFQVSCHCPIVLIQPDCEKLPPLEQVKQNLVHHSKERGKQNFESKTRSDYAHCFDLFIHALREEEFDKLVLSRSQTLKRETAFSPAVAFYRACSRYIYSYVYLCYTPQTGVWLGSTPEIILSGEKGEWNTVALAGTQSLQNGELPLHWDDKNRREQELVATYIRRQLLSLGLRSEEKGPYAAYAGALSHLKTDFYFSLSDNRRLGNLLKLLHPTPAVCGLPKEKAYQFIVANEGYDRRYYSGFIGWLDPEGKTDLYANLRCMNIDNDLLTLYAGGGMLAASELEDEWQETEKKMQTMLAIADPSYS